MNMSRYLICLIIAMQGFLCGACATLPDYTNFRRHRPRSILVLPPLNESITVEATYGYLSTVTLPLAEMGYYVFPVSVIDLFMKENGMPTAGEMHQAPLHKIREIIGADAVLYVTIEQYGTKYAVISSNTIVRVRAKLVDTRTGTLLWAGKANAQQGSGGSGSLLVDVIAAVIHQAVGTASDEAHDVSRTANAILLTREHDGLLYGPYHPKYDAKP
jgi:hypothetical protein